MTQSGPCPYPVAHYSMNDPASGAGGVETFALGLQRVFGKISYLTPDTLNTNELRMEKTVLICDNQHVLDIPEDIPVIGFQHGVAEEKKKHTKNAYDKKLARLQKLAAKRPNTYWIACARWISDRFASLRGNRADAVIYHAVDIERFKPHPKIDREEHLFLHDARSRHKGSRLIEKLEVKFPACTFRELNCPHSQVPEELARGAGFIHLSRYEGNSIMCNEAMAADLPCFFTDVGLFRDPFDFDVYLVDSKKAFRSSRYLTGEFSKFLNSLETKSYNPRSWVMEHASPDVYRKAWLDAVNAFTGRYSDFFKYSERKDDQ